MKGLLLRERDYKGKVTGSTFFELLLLNIETGKAETYSVPETDYNNFKDILKLNEGLINPQAVYNFETVIDNGRVNIKDAEITKDLVHLSVLLGGKK